MFKRRVDLRKFLLKLIKIIKNDGNENGPILTVLPCITLPSDNVAVLHELNLLVLEHVSFYGFKKYLKYCFVT